MFQNKLQKQLRTIFRTSTVENDHFKDGCENFQDNLK